MNRQIRQVTVLILALFLSLALSLTSVQGLARPSLWEAASPLGTLTSDSRNIRTVYAEFGTDRGAILAGDLVIAETVESDDNYAYQRQYPGGAAYAPITGYFSTAFASMTAMEKAGNSVLNGDDPSLFSSRVKSLITGGSQRGGSLELTIDPEVQQVAYDALDGREGSVVVMNPSTGAILAMVSTPSYDPNTLASHDNAAASSAWDSLSQDASSPLVNRAIGGNRYPPGSTFKVITTAAAMRAGMVTPETEVAAPDTLTLPGTEHALSNYAGESCGDGTVTFSHAFKESCNTPFAQLAIDLGDKALAQEAAAWGFDSELSIPLKVTPSVYPTNETQAQTAMAGIGQASVQATPLMMAMVASTVANDGDQMTPHLIARTLDPDLNVVQTTSPKRARKPIDKATADSLTDLMIETVQDGTGRTAHVAGVTVAGKTGTSETGSEEGGPTTWFIGFAGTDIDKPDVAVAVVLDGGAQTEDTATGGSLAGPIASKVIDAAVDQ
ncbi:penicillin-binding protein 2 [Actinomyces slackii]|uniref:Penicillin-binding protein A n=1 Tax=Actinomyces slackii TaxID=52774 RepID=A0A448KAK2_9ACTO|nr:penicillin-binding protein 2 [Actinomyces slackii]VEG73955.1 Penicillin-binding protein A [Actinomyces slackii]